MTTLEWILIALICIETLALLLCIHIYKSALIINKNLEALNTRVIKENIRLNKERNNEHL